MELPAASVPHSVCSAYHHLSSSSAGAQSSRQRRPRPGGKPVVGRCYAVLKQHKTRLYILGRCVYMLLCWHDRDSD